MAKKGKEKPVKDKKKESSLLTGSVVIAVALIILLSFIKVNEKNLLGPFGDLVERGLYLFIGKAAYLLPFLLLFYALNIIKKKFGLKDVKIISGFTIIIISLALFISMVSGTGQGGAKGPEVFTVSNNTFEMPKVNAFYSGDTWTALWGKVPAYMRIADTHDFYKGGAAGEYLARFLISIFNVLGSYIIALLLFILGIVMIEQEHILLFAVKYVAELMVNAYKGLMVMAGKVTEALKMVGQKTGKADKKTKPASSPKAATANKEDDEEDEEEAENRKNKNGAKKEKMTVISTQEQKIKKTVTVAAIKKGDYTLPSTDMLKYEESVIEKIDYKEDAERLEKTLNDFGVQGSVVNVVDGPVIAKFEVDLATGTKISKVESIAENIALAMKVEQVRVAPVSDKGLIGIEIPKKNKKMIYLKEIVENEAFQSSKSLLTMAIGKDLGGTPVVADLCEMPHFLIAGATGSGKSVCVHNIIMSIIFKATPDEVKLMLIDPKRVELVQYKEIPHLMAPVITDARHAAYALNVLVREMENRYDILSKEGARNIVAYNKYVEEFNAELLKDKTAPPEDYKRALPYIVVIIDELADLMTVAKNNVESAIQRIAQMARGVGIHLILATQRPSVDVLTGVIKANFPSRIAFQVTNKTDSRVILDMNGAEALLGKGDMLYAPANLSKPIRGQAAFVSANEVSKITHFISKQRKPDIAEEFIMNEKEMNLDNIDLGGGSDDPLFSKAVELAKEKGNISTSYLQRKLGIGYSKAARMIDDMEEKGLISGADGNKPRNYIAD